MMLEQRIVESAAYIRTVTDKIPQVGLVLGSGLGDYADKITDAVIIPYSAIPSFPVSTVEGHAGQFVIGQCGGKTVIAMQGRFHYYEGYSQAEITIPIRVMKLLGVTHLVLTNAAGGINMDFSGGTLMMINDHINFSGDNPLIGENLGQFGPRFPDMSSVYDLQTNLRLAKAAKRQGIDLQQGVYMMFSGPCYETPAEIRMARVLGADAAGMSTVPEAIVANHCGMKVTGISCITNMAAGVSPTPLNHQEVVETANRVKGTFTQVIDLLLEILQQ